jgi:predicted AlkP superfamily pyrophosphatase or phosphodiesterase
MNSGLISNLSAEFSPPDYEGGSIANIPATIASLLGASFSGLPPLRNSLWEPYSGNIRRVVVLLVDSLGWNIFNKEKSHLEWLLKRSSVQGKITSIFPSTTVAALTSIWTGVAPAQHGLVGLRLFFPDYAVQGQLLKFSPTFMSLPGSLVNAGLKPEDFLQAPGIAQQLAEAGIPTHSFKGRDIVDSALSKMLDRGVHTRHGYISSADMFVHLRQLLESKVGSPLYVNAYWPAIDLICHSYGPEHPSVGAELRAVIGQLKSELVDQLSATARKDTVLFITGDHGHILAPPQQNIPVNNLPELKDLLLMLPGGEPRTPYLFSKQGRKADLIQYLNSHLSRELIAFDTHDALASGLLGPEPHTPDISGRIGDVIAVMKEGFILLNEYELQKVANMLGRHGGMSAAEMEVPWLGIHLDA